jgi:hypothetical protein
MKFVFAKLFITIFLPGIDGGPTLLHWINLPKIFEIYERKENLKDGVHVQLEESP